MEDDVLEFCVDDGSSGDEVICRRLSDIVVKLKGALDMDDWVVDVVYDPDGESDSIADVEFSQHKEARINVYEYRPEHVYKDLIHELMHCKIGMVRSVYERIISSQQELLEGVAQAYEEQVVDGLTRMIGQYICLSPSGQKRQLDLFEGIEDPGNDV